jgi:hypothetical protein
MKEPHLALIRLTININAGRASTYIKVYESDMKETVFPSYHLSPKDRYFSLSITSTINPSRPVGNRPTRKDPQRAQRSGSKSNASNFLEISSSVGEFPHTEMCDPLSKCDLDKIVSNNEKA